MSPENIRDQTYSEKSDVWSFGALLVEIITGGDPFLGIAPVECAAWIRSGVATPLNYVPLGISVPDWVLNLIGRCFTYGPEQRPSFDEIVAFLDDHVPEGVNIHLSEGIRVTDDDDATVVKRRKKTPAKREPAVEPDTNANTFYKSIDAI
jgi:serine/threonine protein kinase